MSYCRKISKWVATLGVALLVAFASTNAADADEPTANLDSTTSQLMVDLMQKEAKITGTTFIFATHDLELLKHISDIVHLKDGQIIKREVHNDQVI